MPPRWSRKPDRQDPEYRRLDDRMNFAFHVAIFAAANSSVWFVYNLKNASWNWTVWFTLIWAAILLIHLVYIAVIANYSLESKK